MKRPMTYRWGLGLVVVTALTVGGQQGSAVSWQGQPPTRIEQQRKAELAKLPLPEAARLAGGVYTRELTTHRWAVASSLEVLAAASELVVVGEVLNQAPVLSADRSYLLTVFTLRALEVVKGKVAPGSIIRATIPGGRMVFDDGAVAETRVPGLEPPSAGVRCVLFLERIEKTTPAEALPASAGGSYVPVLGPQGIFHLTSSGLRAQGRDTDPLKQRHDRQSAQSFLAQLRSLKGR